jgi:hypothetical protein
MPRRLQDESFDGLHFAARRAGESLTPGPGRRSPLPPSGSVQHAEGSRSLSCALRDLFLAPIVAAVLGLAVPLHAQLSTSIEAFVGYYRPFGHFDLTSLRVSGVLPTPSYIIGADMERSNQRDALLHLGLGWTLH